MPSTNPVPTRERLIVALDIPDAKTAREFVTTLGDSAVFYKIGLELFMAGGYFELLDWLLKKEKRGVGGLKFFHIPATVAAAVKQLSGMGATYCTVHGNQSIMEAAAEAKGKLKVLAVTVLTSLDRGDLDDLGFQVDV